MKIDYNALSTFLSQHKKLLEAMSDKEYNDYVNSILDDFHYEEKNEQQ